MITYHFFIHVSSLLTKTGLNVQNKGYVQDINIAKKFTK